jgi:hypothetical protein
MAGLQERLPDKYFFILILSGVEERDNGCFDEKDDRKGKKVRANI